MGLIYRCDGCGLDEESRRCPEGWRMRWISEVKGMEMMCPECRGVAAKERKAAKKAPVTQKRVNGPMFGGGES